MRVTVAIPAYKSKYLGAALESALKQEFDQFEILVCDDSPGEEVAAIVAEHQERHPSVPLRYYRNAASLGEEGNVGECIRRASGHYIKFLYDDDVLLPGCLKSLAEVLDAYPDVALATSRRNRIDEAGDPIRDSGATLSPFQFDVLVEGGDLVSLLGDHTLNFIGEPSAVMVRRAQILPLAGKQFSLGGNKVKWLGDLTMNVNLLRKGSLAYLVKPLSSFRVSREQTSHASHLNPDIGNDWYLYFKHMIRALGWYRHEDNHLVRVARLDAPTQVETIDLGRRIKRMIAGRPPFDRLEQWLSSRKPTASQARQIAQRQDQLGAAAVSIVIRGGQDGPSLARTLKSLEHLDAGFFPRRIFVLDSALPHPGTTLTQLRHVEISGEESELSLVNRIIAEDTSDWFMLVQAGEAFTAAGLQMVAQHLIGTEDVRAIYADEMMLGEDGDLSAVFRPDFNLDLLLSMPSGMARHWLFRRDAFLELGGFDADAADAAELDLLLRLIDIGGLEGLTHVPEPLLVVPPQEIRSRPAEVHALDRHLRNRGYEHASVDTHLPGCYRIHYGHQATPGVSIIIPTKNQLGMLQRCVETLLEKTAYKNYEVLIVDNGSDEADAVAWLDGIESLQSPQLRVLRYPHPFNYSAINNFAASQARGEYLVLLNNDTAILREDWLDALLNHAQRPELGIVGAKLLYPNGTIQHAGVILGLRGPAEHPFIDEKLDAPGYMYRLQVDQDYTAVTGACLMVRKSLYAEVGGLDEEAFKVSYNDVDLCLKVRSAGYLVVWTPHALVLHEGSVSQKQVDQATQQAKVKRFREEQDVMYDRWLPWIARDPAYNRNLTLQGRGFAVDVNPQHNWHPLESWRPLPVAVALAADQDGCGQYRIIQPVNAMNTFGVADAEWSGRYYSPIELERRQPDVIVLQRQMFEDKMAQQKRLARFSRAFRVAELDDYLPLLPRKSAHHGQLPKDVLRTMREALKLVDRFVVSTPELAEALDGLHGDIRVVENHLPLPWWQNVGSGRREGGKPRVGWGGGAGHRGDLELIADVVRALADEVDWVFFGMCPESLRPYVREYHPPVAIADYPAKLASLDLDLALAPLEDNLFNRCKSNLRLLEYGACGFPVVCSDIAPYQGDLPVTRVKPRFRDWVDAIQMHVSDQAAAAKAGDALRAAVHQDWMLDERHARFWISQWLPD